ncbi:heavy metal translocating P-type ATPase [Nocardia farcinica]|nr:MULTISPECIES: heavy metal translocating P-type ATPase [Nocardia]AVH24961.1 copper-translocating P-type ATPase [Nocardia cyriacigeorgica]MBF6072724.1 heavy metal translocating P-type ATPase [Nocardia farcinica]MBF6188579.1 heavy metal translocating P-type ATPase [Nocardia farcinica]MBF6234624.1 heavy metal translocating P-type ATPase [Nocardia farcinica]MBF6253863.1 heavy metal translocating P-type ATPase [Nocardia farcinica]
MFRRLFWVMLALAVPVVAADMMFADLIGYTVPTGLQWVSPALGTVMFFWGGRPFLTGAVSEIRSRQPGMMLLIALAITVAFAASWGSTLGLLAHELDFWWELALLIVIMLLGHWIEMRSLGQASSALESLAALLPDEAERLGEDGTTATVPVTDLRTGDLVVVRPGGRVPADGSVETGSADVDESMITGESRPVHRGPGDRVVAGTVTTDSALRVRITAVGSDTALAGIQRLVAEAQNSTSRAQVLADRAAAWLFWFASGAAVITAITWLLLGQPESAVTRTITVLVIACPHALGLAIPLVVSIATERAAKAGVLITDRRALERMRTVDAILFDKTGTLTRGEPAVVATTSTQPGIGDDEVLALAAAAESDSEHPLGRAIVNTATERGISIPTATDFTAQNGVGVTATINGTKISVGGPAMLDQHNLDPAPAAAEWSAQGSTVLHVLRDGKLIGALALADEIRPESAQTIKALHARGIHVAMITGDAEPVARTVAAQLGIDEVFAGVLPQDKGAKVQALQDAGHTVAMVGDGVNDAPALARADVGIAIGAGTDVAIASAGVVLASDDPRAVLSVIKLSHATYRKMIQNLVWAAGYNIIAVPLAAGVLSHWGITLPMEVGALLMSASTVVVAVNAQLLRRLDLSPDAVLAD